MGRSLGGRWHEITEAEARGGSRCAGASATRCVAPGDSAASAAGRHGVLVPPGRARRDRARRRRRVVCAPRRRRVVAPRADAAWIQLPGPTAPNSTLNGVSCLPTAVCAAVGEEGAGPLVIGPSAGGWSPFASPIPAGMIGSLEGVSCSSLTNCMAVGHESELCKLRFCSPDSFREFPLTDQWNGKVWSTGEAASPHRIDRLAADSCTSGSFCAAVGTLEAGISPPPEPLSETWDGTEWSVEHVKLAAPVAELQGVSCVSPAFCVAVGSATKVLVWNGSEWAEVSSSPERLSSVSCIGGRRVSCTAVGSEHGAPLIAESTGGAWSIASAPIPASGGYVRLLGVSCVARGRCVAVGSDELGTESIKTIVEVERGGRWSIVPTPNTAAVELLRGVSCTPARWGQRAACVAVGQSGTQPLIEYGAL